MKTFNEIRGLTEARALNWGQMKSKYTSLAKKLSKKGLAFPDEDSRDKKEQQFAQDLIDYIYDNGIVKTDDYDKMIDAMEHIMGDLADGTNTH